MDSTAERGSKRKRNRFELSSNTGIEAYGRSKSSSEEATGNSYQRASLTQTKNSTTRTTSAPLTLQNKLEGTGARIPPVQNMPGKDPRHVSGTRVQPAPARPETVMRSRLLAPPRARLCVFTAGSKRALSSSTFLPLSQASCMAAGRIRSIREGQTLQRRNVRIAR